LKDPGRAPLGKVSPESHPHWLENVGYKLASARAPPPLKTVPSGGPRLENPGTVKATAHRSDCYPQKTRIGRILKTRPFLPLFGDEFRARIPCGTGSFDKGHCRHFPRSEPWMVVIQPGPPFHGPRVGCRVQPKRLAHYRFPRLVQLYWKNIHFSAQT